MGGWKKTQGRVPPRFMNEELCHRNMAFSLYQADEMPQMKSGETKVEAIGGGVYRVRVDFDEPEADADDPGQGRAEQRRAARPADRRGRGHRGAVGRLGARASSAPGRPSSSISTDPKRILIRNGHAGRTTRTIEYLVRGTGTMTVTYDSAKGGKATAKVAVK